MWLVVMSRLDIANAVRAVARHSINPTERHWKAVLQIIRYLLGTKDLGITFERRSGLDLSLFTDSDCAEKANDRRSVSGIAVVLGNAAVSYSSNTQKIIAQSAAESEYVAVGDGVKEGLFVRQVLGFLVPSLSEKCIKIFVDNDAAISVTDNPLSSGRTKHIDVRFHFIRELVRSKTILVKYVPSSEQRADVLTKPLTGALFKAHTDFLMNFRM